MKAKNRYFKNFLFATIGFGCPFALVCSILFANLWKGLILGIGAGFLYGILSILFNLLISNKMDKIRVEIVKEETVIFEGAANHWIGNISKGGWLFFTDKYLYFVPHKFNLSKMRVQILRHDIQEVTISKKINSMNVHFGDGQIESFVVNERNTWIRMLNQ